MSGESALSLARRTGIKSTRMYRYLRSNGAVLRPSGMPVGTTFPKKITLEQRAEIIKELERGLRSHQSIADQFGVCRQRVSAIARPQPRKSRKRDSHEKKPKVHRKRYDDYRSVKNRASRALVAAVRAGRIVRKPCEVCGDPKTHGHHTDYSKPLDVKWFCPVHHREVHGISDREIILAFTEQRS